MRTAKYRALERDTLARLAHVAPAIPDEGARVSVYARARHGFDIARLYPANLVVAPEIGAQGRAERSPNLIRMSCDGACTTIPEGGLDASLVIGATPDIVGRAADREAFGKFIRGQRQQLKDGGMLVLRDSVGPEDDFLVRLDLPLEHRDALGVAPAEAFRTFVKARMQEHIPAKAWESIVPLRAENPACESVLVPRLMATEFLLTLPWYRDWDRELLRPYTALQASERAEALAREGFRILYDGPLSGTLLEEEMLKGIRMSRPEDGAALLLQPYQVTLAEKVEPGSGVQIVETSSRKIDAGTFLAIDTYEERDGNGEVTGVRELVTRRHGEQEVLTHDVVPYFFVDEKELHIVARTTPRPLAAMADGGLDRARVGAYHTEQLGAVVPVALLGREEGCEASARHIARERGGIDDAVIEELLPATRYFTRPDSVDEYVVSQAIRISGAAANQVIGNSVYGLRTLPRVRTVEAKQYLQGCQMGAFRDGRLERQVYAIAMRHEVPVGEWLGKVLQLEPQDTSVLQQISGAEVAAPPQRARFHPRNLAVRPGVLQLKKSVFSEVDAQGQVVGTATLEHVSPAASTHDSNEAFAVLPLVCGEDGIIRAGVQLRDFPAAQMHTGTSALYTVPTARCPEGKSDLREGQAWFKDEVERRTGLSIREILPLGGPFCTTPGNTRELMHPMCCSIEVAESPMNVLSWPRLDELLAHIDELGDGILRTLVLRAAHMEELLKLREPTPDDLVAAARDA